MMDRARVVLDERQFRQYLNWMGKSWELKDLAQIEFAYFALRRDGR